MAVMRPSPELLVATHETKNNITEFKCKFSTIAIFRSGATNINGTQPWLFLKSTNLMLYLIYYGILS